MKPLLCSLLHSPVTSSLLGQDTYLHKHTIFEHLRSARDQVLHPYKKEVNYSPVYFNLHVFGQKTGR